MLAVTPIKLREGSFMYAKASAPSPSNSSLKRFIPSRNARQNIPEPIGSPWWTPLEQANVLVSPESIRKTRQLVPYHNTWPLTA